MFSYQGINFAKGFKMTLAKFKKTYASQECFLNIPHLERDAEMERVWKIATKENVKLSNNTSKRKKSNKSES